MSHEVKFETDARIFHARTKASNRQTRTNNFRFLIGSPSKPVHEIHDPRGLAILAQLRVGLSKLNFHKFSHNFRETIDPMCPSNDGFEDTEHYLLRCQCYEEPRCELFSGLSAILPPSDISNLSNELLVEIILYGNEMLPTDVHKGLMEATLKFVHATMRF